MTPNELYYQIGKDTILYQSSLHREFADRAFNLLNLSVATLVAGGVVINFRLDHLEWTWPVIGLGTLAILAFIVVAVRCLIVLSVRDWHSFPPLGELSDRMRILRATYPHLTAEQSGALLPPFTAIWAVNNQRTLSRQYHLIANDPQVVLRDELWRLWSFDWAQTEPRNHFNDPASAVCHTHAAVFVLPAQP